MGLMRILSLLAAVGYVVAFRHQFRDDGSPWYIPFVFAAIGLALIWFNHFFASFSYTRVGSWQQRSSPTGVACVGWLILLFPPVFLVARYLVIHWP